MPYLSINETDKIIINPPKFQTNLALQKSLREINQSQEEEVEFVKTLRGLTCLPVTVNTVLGYDAKLTANRSFLEKFFEHSNIITIRFSKIAQLIRNNKNNLSLLEKIFSKKLQKTPDQYIKQGKKLHYPLFKEFLSNFLQECLSNGKDNPVFQNLKNSSIKQYLDVLDKTMENINKDEPLSLNVWLEHILYVNEPLIFNRIFMDFQSELNADETVILEYLQGLPDNLGIKEQQLLNMQLHIAEFQKALIEKFGFQRMPEAWEPLKNAGIDGLIQFIRDHGCIIVGGYFGQAYHSEQAKLKKGNDFSYYYWPKNSFTVNFGKFTPSHTVILIGACKKSKNNDQDMVFIMDPSTDWGGSYKIYAISYKSFCERISFETSLLKTHPLTHNSFLVHPQLKLTKKPNLLSSLSAFWPEQVDCKTVTKAVVATASVAMTLNYLISKNNH